jgi:hypothetical protein
MKEYRLIPHPGQLICGQKSRPAGGERERDKNQTDPGKVFFHPSLICYETAYKSVSNQVLIELYRSSEIKSGPRQEGVK